MAAEVQPLGEHRRKYGVLQRVPIHTENQEAGALGLRGDRPRRRRLARRLSG